MKAGIERVGSRAAAACFLALLFASSAAADTVILSNGQRLENVRTKLNRDSLEVRHPNGRRQSIPLRNVRRILRTPVRPPLRQPVQRRPARTAPVPDPSVPVPARKEAAKMETQRTGRRIAAVVRAPHPTGRAHTAIRIRPARADRPGPARRPRTAPISRIDASRDAFDDLFTVSLLPCWSGLLHVPERRLWGFGAVGLEAFFGLAALIYLRPQPFPNENPLARAEQLLLLFGAAQQQEPAVQTYSVVRLQFLEGRVAEPGRDQTYIRLNEHRARLRFFAGAFLAVTTADLLLLRRWTSSEPRNLPATRSGSAASAQDNPPSARARTTGPPALELFAGTNDHGGATVGLRLRL